MSRRDDSNTDAPERIQFEQRESEIVTALWHARGEQKAVEALDVYYYTVAQAARILGLPVATFKQRVRLFDEQRLSQWQVAQMRARVRRTQR